MDWKIEKIGIFFVLVIFCCQNEANGEENKAHKVLGTNTKAK